MERANQILRTVDFHSDEDRYAERLRFSGCCSSSWKNCTSLGFVLLKAAVKILPIVCSAQLYTELHNFFLVLSPTNQTMKCEKALTNVWSSQISFLCNNRMLWKRVTITAYDWNIGTLTQQTQAVTPLANQLRDSSRHALMQLLEYYTNTNTLCEDGTFERDMV